MRGENLRLRAMALTYLTLFALVPGLVVAFAVVNKAGFKDGVLELTLPKVEKAKRHAVKVE